MSASDSVRVCRALISVSDKDKLVERATALNEMGVELVSTGGTAKALKEAGLPVRDVSELTHYPEMMDGRVKTLHPGVHGGLLARRDLEAHTAAMEEHGISGIDLLWVNLYPFEATIARGADYDDAIENIDIGGPAMIRAAAKNHAHVAVCVDSEAIEETLAEMKEQDGATTYETRQKLAARAYARTAAYDAAISNWFAKELGDDAPAYRAFGGSLKQTMRYGENPHQSAAFYTDGSNRPGVATAEQVQGKELSYNNINDTDAAFELAAEFDPADGPAIAIIKHANPCGVAVGKSQIEAYRRALECDPVSAFGGIVAANMPLDGETAAEIVKVFTEVVIAPGADEAAMKIFAGKKNLRLLLTGGMPDPRSDGLSFRNVAGGMLVQGRDARRITADDLNIVTRRQPTDQEVADMLFAFTVGKHVKSNAIVYAKDGQTAGIGAGQMNRKDSARIAAMRAAEAAEMAEKPESLAKGSACASDAFFPFADGLLQAAEAGATAIIQPGGSIRDEEVIAAADEHDLTMAFTGVRHFRH
ncbi:MAG: bifunctional phosphoribosylaminoimidazolecarboxamide formyltransferase/IMP cyclohydrolase [Euryhalocaulis sp.]|uniref:bifunctional phosphoribosylaminoimidazolecarboxamide formyltransferase/IMP cyclohydrolase n=1 Tax=Euryhalocaulis sp. TaxID=2744307 RepID=UPI0017931B12|nr:bifunctional phosphoribosylaminoimidazolecarboxamide formyltransferase/IMP cyclohydrolase [Euryhalocaulis sp.]MBA4802027.1 bifunctional phosphoribosylaminoimidazolecarboxamide formyltransferase/IMP cyclohydrolase [Euryhalocaulis sp.]